MEVIFIRHGEPDKELVDMRGFMGMGRDMAPLTKKGIEQAEKVAENPNLKDAQIILSSPYTRALQTAAIISKRAGIDITVEIDLHEFIPDKTFLVKGEIENDSLHKDFIKCEGEYPNGEIRKWETISEIISRSQPVLDKYLESGYKKIIVVAHGGVIRRYTGISLIDHCKAITIQYEKGFTCFQWV